MSKDEKYWPELEKQETVFKEFIQVDKLKLKDAKEKYDRYLVQRPDAVAAILYHREAHAVVLVEQLRIAALAAKDPEPHLWEIPAGLIDQDQSPEETVVREVAEETGYRIENPRFLVRTYSSPGLFSEKVHLFYAEVSDRDKHYEGGGLDKENEYIKVIHLPISDMKEKLEKGQFKDGKTIMALQWLEMQLLSKKL